MSEDIWPQYNIHTELADEIRRVLNLLLDNIISFILTGWWHKYPCDTEEAFIQDFLVILKRLLQNY